MLLTDRDLRIMEWLHECRFLTREQIERLEFGPGATSAAKRRLTLLYHNGYLGRLHLPLRDAYGASRAAYYLDRRGAQSLAGVLRASLDELNWRRRDGEQEETFLAHTLDVNDVRIAFTLASRHHGLGLEWLDERALRRMDVLQRIKGAGGETATLLPDAYFTIGGVEGIDGFALEVDRGTVSERRMRARIRAYGEWATSGAYRRHLPAESLRVIFAVTGSRRGEDRLALLKRWCEEEGGRSLFWFTDGMQVAGEDILSAPVWQVGGRTGRVSLPLSAAGR
ncbi:MAG: replication-relaxation family protein [Bacillota bacterium]|nr:replication-relaxation family protein [Bacillota bacterium]